jgi:hypothetical protein
MGIAQRQPEIWPLLLRNQNENKDDVGDVRCVRTFPSGRLASGENQNPRNYPESCPTVNRTANNIPTPRIVF